VRRPNEICSLPHATPPLVIRIFGLKVGPGPFDEWKCPFEELNPHVNIFTGSYLDISKYWATQSSLPFNKGKSKILMKPLRKDIIKEVSKFFAKLEARNPNYLVYFNFESFGGKMKDNQTAFFPRDAFGWWFQAYYWGEQEESAKVLALSNQFYAKLPRKMFKYSYANIVDYDLGRGYLKAYYGDHVDALISIKNKYDPSNLFHWKQSIPPYQIEK
jgi:hypothetical protein